MRMLAAASHLLPLTTFPGQKKTFRGRARRAEQCAHAGLLAGRVSAPKAGQFIVGGIFI